MTVWVLASYGHRLHISGVFASYEAAVESLRDYDEEDVEEDELLEGCHLEEFIVES